jgi:hypothetical protein
MIRKKTDQIIIVGTGDCFKPYSDFNDDVEVLYIHEAPDKCSTCTKYWNQIETK